MATSSFSISIRGSRWTIRLRHPPAKEKTDGLCYVRRKEIWIDPKATPSRRRYLVAHELTHAINEELDEDLAGLHGDCVEQALQKIDKLLGP